MPPKSRPTATHQPPGVPTFGARLRAARLAAGRTLREVAEPSGLSLNYLSDLERDVLSNPALDKLRSLAATLNVSIDSLLGLEPAGHEVAELPLPLAEFAASPEFHQAIRAEADRLKVDPAVMAEAWLDALGSLQVLGRRPHRALDYMFIFEAARRAIDGR
ncbi:helix-turn-helix domain-containing protein [Oryzobacter telluris]|uniref:helix-turn-helix domain-containing protein n=1 Tax=Oryzobacter telluris TaxID=3149179 RepID=UPI00370DB9D3